MSAWLAEVPKLLSAINETKLPWDEVTFSKNVFLVCGAGEALLEQSSPRKYVFVRQQNLVRTEI
jgi:hypothetical protein